MKTEKIKQVVKRKGYKEKYDKLKVYASVYSASLNCHHNEIDSEKIASSVTKKVTNWIKNKKLVKSSEIRSEVIKHLKGKDKDIALMYHHHLDLS